MKKLISLLTAAASFSLMAADSAIDLTQRGIPGTPRNLNSATTKGYGDSAVQTQLRLEVKDSTGAVHFIRDNTDPYVITRTYELKHTEAYAMRGYLLAMVLGTKVSASPVQVEALKFNDGRSLVLVSAEDYRFRDAGNGQSIDEVIASLDQPGLGFSSGRPKFIYFPKINSAANLLEMVRNVGANGSDTEFIGGVDVLMVDGPLNALVVGAPFWSWKHIKEMLDQYDKPMPEVRISYKLVEIYAENDDKIGIDFQSWKNNDGADFFSVGGQYRNNWASTFAGGVNNSGSSKTEYYNFNPKWNSKYIDFLTSSGKARVVTEGVLLAKNRETSTIAVSSGLFYDDVSQTIPETTVNDLLPGGRGPVPAPGGEVPIQHGKEQITKVDNGFRYVLKINPVVTARSTGLTLAAVGSSLIGWNGDGSPRISHSGFNTEVQIGNSGKDFVLGGIRKTEVVRGVAGLPFIKDLPFIGWIFSTESESTKRSQLVLIARAEYSTPLDPIKPELRDNLDKLLDGIDEGVKSPVNNLGFQQLLIDTDKLE